MTDSLQCHVRYFDVIFAGFVPFCWHPIISGRNSMLLKTVFFFAAIILVLEKSLPCNKQG